MWNINIWCLTSKNLTHDVKIWCTESKIDVEHQYLIENQNLTPSMKFWFYRCVHPLYWLFLIVPFIWHLRVNSLFLWFTCRSSRPWVCLGRDPDVGQRRWWDRPSMPKVANLWPRPDRSKVQRGLRAACESGRRGTGEIPRLQLDGGINSIGLSQAKTKNDHFIVKGCQRYRASPDFDWKWPISLSLLRNSNILNIPPHEFHTKRYDLVIVWVLSPPKKYSLSQSNGTVSRLLEITVYIVKFNPKFLRTVCRQLKYNDFFPLCRQFPLRRQLERWE